MKLYESTQVGKRPYRKLLSSSFDLLEYSCEARAALLRGTLEEWFSIYPKGHGRELKKRIRHCDQHDSAVFELFFFNVLTRLGYTVTPHPHLTDEGGRPDFLCCVQDEPVLCVELCQRWDVGRKSREFQRHVGHLVDQVFSTSDFWVKVQVRKYTQPGQLDDIECFLRGLVDRHPLIEESVFRRNVTNNHAVFTVTQDVISHLNLYKDRRI